MSSNVSSASKKLKAIIKSISLKNDKIHIYSLKNEWAVKKEGDRRSLKTVSDRKDALGFARSLASKSKEGSINYIIIHKKNGSIETKLSTSRKKASHSLKNDF